MNLCIQVLYVINARIRIVQNFVDQPWALTSSASSRGVFVLLYKAFMRAKIYDKQGNLAIRFYKQRYAERYEISFKENNPAIGLVFGDSRGQAVNTSANVMNGRHLT